MLEELTLASGPMERPVAMFVDRSNPALTRAAIEAGVKGIYGPGTPIPASAKDVLEQIKKALG